MQKPLKSPCFNQSKGDGEVLSTKQDNHMKQKHYPIIADESDNLVSREKFAGDVDEDNENYE